MEEFVLLGVLTLKRRLAQILKIWAKPLLKNEKGPLLIDGRRSQSSSLSSLFAIKLDCMCLPLSHKALACYTNFGHWSNEQTATSES